MEFLYFRKGILTIFMCLFEFYIHKPGKIEEVASLAQEPSLFFILSKCFRGKENVHPSIHSADFFTSGASSIVNNDDLNDI